MVALLLTACVILGLGLACFLFLLLVLSSSKSYLSLHHAHKIEVIKVVEALREVCPVGCLRGWTLTHTWSGLRCWCRQFPMPFVGSQITVFGSSIQMNVSAVTVLNIIADVSTWPEWDISSQHRPFHPEVADEPELHGDNHMQSDHLAMSLNGSKPTILVHRFGNLESNGVGWILIWLVDKLDWCFYLAQPIEGPVGDKSSHCLLTAIQGASPQISSTENISQNIAEKLKNLKDAICTSRLHIRPFMPLLPTSSALNNPHLPTIHTSLSDLPDAPCVLLSSGTERHRPFVKTKDSFLCLVPLSSSKSITLSNLAGFALISQPLKKLEIRDESGKNEARNSVDRFKARRRTRIYSDSTLTSPEEEKRGESKNILERQRSSSIPGSTVPVVPPSLTVTTAEDEAPSPAQQPHHSFLDVIFHPRRSADGSRRSRSKSPSSNISSLPLHPRKKSVSSASSHEDLSVTTADESSKSSSHVSRKEKWKRKKKTEGPVSSSDQMTSSQSYKIILANVNKKGSIAHYKSVGEFSVSSVLAEAAKISSSDIHTSDEDQKKSAGGWEIKDIQKDIKVFTKLTTFGTATVMSYLTKGIIASSSHLIWRTLCNPLSRFMYDDTVKKISVLQEYPNGQKILHMYHESVTLLKKEIQEFCLLQTEKQEEGQQILAFHSVEYEDKLAPKEITPGIMLPSGWIVETNPENSNSSAVTYLLQLVMQSTENQLVEEMGTSQPQCLNNLSAYLSTKPLC